MKRAGLRGALALALACAGSARAEDGNHVARFVVGANAALASSESLNAAGTQRTSVRFPKAPEVRARTRIAGGIGQAPTSDAAGNLFIAHAEPRLSKLDSSGRSLWSVRLPSEAFSAPVLLADGGVLLITREGEALIHSSAGALVARRALPLGDARRRFLAIPSSSSGAWVANGRDVLELDGRARVVRRLRARGALSALLEAGSAWLAIGESGSVELARASGDFELVAELGGNAPDGAAVRGGHLFALVDGHRLLALDLSKGQSSTLVSEPSLALTGPLALLPRSAVAFVADGGFVSLRAADGSESLRVPLSSGQGFEPALRGLRPALLITDDSGSIAAVRSGNDALVIGDGGASTRLEGTACLDPFRATPAPHGLVLACRSGQLFFVAERQ